jgi:hypothetical protein
MSVGYPENKSYKMENISMVGIQNRVTYESAWWRMKHAKNCGLFEKRLMDCASNYGQYGADEKCKDQKIDLTECETNDIKNLRYQRMQEERQKRGLPFKDPPPYDTVYFHTFKHNA